LVVGKTPISTPWRVLMVSASPGGLIENNYLILNLNPPCALADTSWIQPGKAAWNWWSGTLAGKVDFKPGMNTATMKYYVDFAAAHHLEYMIIDGGWSPFNDMTHPINGLDIRAITSYANAKGVRVIVWALWTTVQEQMKVAFPLYEKWGIAGVKIDFVDRDDQEMVYFYRDMVRTAAKYHLVIDFHPRACAAPIPT
jgi:alpha-glucosidase